MLEAGINLPPDIKYNIRLMPGLRWKERPTPRVGYDSRRGNPEKTWKEAKGLNLAGLLGTTGWLLPE